MLGKCHFIGIGGIGMSGLARLLLGRNIPVSGSDIASSSVIEALTEAGANVYIGHSAQHILPDMTIVYSTDIKKDNPEYQAALTLKCPMLHRSELLQLLMSTQRSLAVAGTHGKTTTSSLLTWVLEASGLSPSYAIGGVIPQLTSNAGHGNGDYFVAEACESDGTFLNYAPFGAIVTNIDFDHMDHFHSEIALIEAFKQFMNKVSEPQHLFWCGDDHRLKNLHPKGISYGFGKDCELKASNFRQKEWTVFFDAVFKGKTYADIEVSLSGQHNALNALAVFGLALSLGLSESAIRNALRSFGGVLRRCEKKGSAHGIQFIDDYGHHPTEIRATLKAIRNAIGSKRLVVLYQPHRFSRAKECMGMYQGSFDEADLLFVTEIYAAREKPIPGVTHEKIIAEIQQDLKERCQHAERSQLTSLVLPQLRPHDVVVTLGAGDITKASIEILSQIALKSPPKLKVGVFFGGVSVEHEVSLMSVEFILGGLNPQYYEVECFGITRQGVWINGLDALNKLKAGETGGDGQKISAEIFAKVMACDVLFPVMHGTFGEDGTIQGLFEMFGKAYAGPDYRSAAISMDKALTKRLVLEAGISTAAFVSFTKHGWDTESEKFLKRIEKELRYPLFVKPVHLGSSFGVYKVFNEGELCEAIEKAFHLDTRLVVENGIEGREIEFAVLGNDELTAFPPGEIFPDGIIYTYSGKYGPNATKSAAVAELPLPLVKEGIDFAKKTYRAIGCTGMARVDTFLDRDGKYWLNEINPIPGCTKNSMFPLICAANGLTREALVDLLLILGLHRRRQLNCLETRG